MTLSDWTTSPLWFAAGLTMLHYSWLGGLVAAAALLARCLSTSWGAAARYRLALSFLGALAALPLGVFAWSLGRTPPAAVASAADSEAGSTSARPQIDRDAAEHAPSPAAEFAADAAGGFPTEKQSGQAEATADASSSVDLEGGDFQSGDLDTGDMESGDLDTGLAVVRTNEERLNGETPWPVSLVAWLPWLWVIGTPLTLLLLATGCVGAARLRRKSEPLEGKTAALCRRLARTLNVMRPVAVAVCERIAAPILVGVLRPVVLLPPAALTNWTTAEVEMALLHELAHVRRWDNLVNLLQRLVESLLFYQPAVWIVSDWVRREREHACDELVVRQTGRSRDYAALLARLAAAQAGEASLFEGVVPSPMARSHLASRLRYLIYREYEPMRISARFWTMAGVVLLAALGVAGWHWAGPRSAAVGQDDPAAGGLENDAQRAQDAAEEAPPASPTIAKELLRYDGKSFAEWSNEWRTELKPERRQEAIEAFRVFAVNGFGPEAARAIVEVMRNYNAADLDNSPEGRLKSAALNAIGAIAAKDVLPVLDRELRRGTVRGKVFVLTALNRHDGPREALPAVLEVVDDQDPLVRKLALGVLDDLAANTDEVSDVSAVLLKAMQDEDPTAREAAIYSAAKLNLTGKPFVAAYRTALRDEDARVVDAALAALVPRRRSGGLGSGLGDAGGRFGGGYPPRFPEGGGISGRPSAGLYAPEMVDVLKRSDDFVWRQAAESLEVLGPQAKEAVTPLVALACRGAAVQRQRAEYTLRELAGNDSLEQPIADEIVKVLKADDRDLHLPALQLLYELQGELGAAGTATIPAVTALLEDENEKVRQGARMILDRYVGSGGRRGR